MEHLFSKRVKHAKASEIREILKLTQKPEIISFAGGLPAPELFPVEAMKAASQKVLDTMGQEALQYSTTEGYVPLREHIVSSLKAEGIDAAVENVLITSGSQQGLDFTGKIFLDPGDTVLCESPSYLGAINAFKAYECTFKEIETDAQGMNLAHLEQVLQETPRAKYIYVIPDFQNPSGRTWSEARRKGLVELAKTYNVVVIEDNPYGALRFEGKSIPAIKAYDTDGRVVYLGTFSKTLAPGLRIGWVLAAPELLSKYITVKQSADLQTSSISQRELSVFLDDNDLNAHVERIKHVYKRRRDLMVATMDAHFPKSVSYEIPSGGLFIWVTLPEGIHARQLLERAVEKQVAFVPGGSFFPNGGRENALRLNYSNMSEERIVEGVKRLGVLLSEALLLEK